MTQPHALSRSHSLIPITPQAEDALVKQRVEFEEARDRYMAKDGSQFTEIRKLRAQVRAGPKILLCSGKLGSIV